MDTSCSTTFIRELGNRFAKWWRIPEIQRFQDHFTEYKIVVYGDLDYDDIISEGQLTSEKRVSFLYDDVTRHFHVIANLTGALSKRYICTGCSKSCRSGVTHKCRETCTDCMSIRPCIFTDVRIPCEACNRNLEVKHASTSTRPIN